MSSSRSNERQRNRDNRERIGPYAALGLCLVLASVFWIHRIRVDAPSLHNFYGNGDLYTYHLPSAVFIHDELRAGRLPTWNPYQFAGQPFAALHVTSALYPPNLLTLAVFSPARALELQAVLHLALAGFFTWLFAGRIGLAPPARLLAGAAFAFSPPMLHAVYQVPYLYTQAWLPALLWATTGLAQQARGRWALALAVFLALAFLGGHAQGFLFELQLTLCYAAFALVAITPRALRLRAFGLLSLSGVIALALVAPQLLATLELVGDAVRSLEGVPFEEAAAGSVRPSGLLTGVLGRPFANEAARWVTWPLLGLPLALLGVVAPGRRRIQLFFLVAALVTGLLALGQATPLFRLYYALPLGDVFRVPNRISFAYVFLVGLMAAVGLQALSDLLGRGRFARACAVATALVVVAASADLYANAQMRFAHPALSLDRSRSVDRLIAALGPGMGFWRLFLEMGRSFDRPDIDRKLGQMNGLFVVPDYEPTMLASYRAYFRPERRLWHGAVSITPGGRTRDADDLARLLDLMSVRYYASGRPTSARALHRGLLLEFTGGTPRGGRGVVLIERAAALPRAYTVRCGEWARDEDTALARMLRPGFRPGREAVLIGSAPENAGFPDPVCATGEAPPSQRASIIAYDPHEVVVETSCTTACLLVLTDLQYPGWHARVDGEERTLIRANVLFRGLLLDPGHHRIEYRYEPAALRVGLALAGICLLITAAVATARTRVS